MISPVCWGYAGVNLNRNGDIESCTSRAQAQPTGSSKKFDGY
ncbi:MAG TPA: hypothetical protein VNX26_14060 [Candidatus Acidoferrum sp.]|nr:hypothetical protein [Candidatus Acidoferrum sp.]